MRESATSKASSHGASPAPSGPDWWANIRVRVATAAVLIPIVIALAWLGGWITLAAVLLVLMLATRELERMFARRGWRLSVAFSLALGVDFCLAAKLPDLRLFLLAIGISGSVAGTTVWLMATRPVRDETLVEWALTLAVPLYLGWPLAFVVALRGDGVGMSAPGFWWLLILLLAVWANDSGALFFGHFLGRGGRHPLARHISPNKTWEGVAGGAALAIIVVLVVAGIGAHVPGHPLPSLAWYRCVALGALIAAAATVGDLSKSLLKRITGVKDSGRLLPGHGGMLDRCDSVLFAALVVYFYALALGAV